PAAKYLIPHKGQLPRPPQGLVRRPPALPRGPRGSGGAPAPVRGGRGELHPPPPGAGAPGAGRRGHRGDHRQLPPRPRDPQRLAGAHGGAARPARLGRPRVAPTTSVEACRRGDTRAPSYWNKSASWIVNRSVGQD